MIPTYCTQNNGICPTCSLVNYGRDCANKSLAGRFFTVGDLAETITGGNITAIAKLLNDAGITPRLDERNPDPAAYVMRGTVIDLAATNAGIIGRRAGKLLGGR